MTALVLGCSGAESSTGPAGGTLGGVGGADSGGQGSGAGSVGGSTSSSQGIGGAPSTGGALGAAGTSNPSGGANTGGAANAGGAATTGGAGVGGATGLGGATATGGALMGGSTASGGTAVTGGAATGGTKAGGGTRSGGAPGAGGSGTGATSSTGGASNPATGGKSSGGATGAGGSATGATSSTGGAVSGGASSGGSTGCGVPSSFKWTSSDALINPISDSTHNLASIKDPSIVYYNGRWHIYATVFNVTTNLFNMVYLNFTDWSQAGAATQYYMDATPGFTGYHCAPQLFYFTPQNKWYLIYQSGPPQYSTSSDPSQPSSWTRPASFFASSTPPAIVTDNSTNPNGVTWIDFWVICDSANCYMFFENDDGVVFRSQTTLANFPSGFNTPVIALQGNRNDIFESSNVYKIKGANKYLLLVEAIGSGRYFRSWTADTLDGVWTPLAATQTNPFAGLSNVTFTGTRWANGISHGEMLRDGYDETLTIDTCNLQYLYQGEAADASSYSLNPYKLGLLTHSP